MSHLQKSRSLTNSSPPEPDQLPVGFYTTLLKEQIPLIGDFKPRYDINTRTWWTSHLNKQVPVDTQNNSCDITLYRSKQEHLFSLSAPFRSYSPPPANGGEPPSVSRTICRFSVGTPAVVHSCCSALLSCFVCLIKETRSKLMERYKPKLPWRKQEQWAIYRRFLSLQQHSATVRQGVSMSFACFLSHRPKAENPVGTSYPVTQKALNSKASTEMKWH